MAESQQREKQQEQHHHQPPPPTPTPPSDPPNPVMSESPISDSPRYPSWFTPKRLLVMFCVINLINYVDRGAIASNGVNIGICDPSGICTAGTGIQGDFKLSNFEDGSLSSAFMVGLLVASPIFASLAKSHNPFRLIGVGLSIWTFATAGCGGSINFWTIAICRMLVGVGEASFISLAAPFIDDHAPATQKTAWLAMFYMCIPTGIALGYVYGGFVGSSFSWRYAFWGEALSMLPFCVLAFVMKPLELKGLAPADTRKTLEPIEATSPLIEDAFVRTGTSGGSKMVNVMTMNDSDVTEKASWPSPAKKSLSQLSRFSRDMKVLLLHKVYVANVLGYVSYNFVIGAYSYWGPKAGYDIYHMNKPDLWFGAITIVCGILGTLAGGLILDAVTATIYNAFKLLSVATFLGAIFCFSAFCVRNLYGFVVLFALGELLVFATQAPVNYVSLRCVTPSLRPMAMAISTVSIHIFGDVPSSPLAGILQDHVKNWRITTLAVTSVLFLASGIWFLGIFVSNKGSSDEDGKEEVSTVETVRKPLEENRTEGAKDPVEA